MKREFLVQKCKSLHKYLFKNADSCKLYKYSDKDSHVYDFENYTYVLEEYKKTLDGLNILVLISKDEVILDKKIEKLQEVTKDKRYKSKYLKLFGNPKNYDFDVRLVFKKCDDVGLSRLDLHFDIGMSCSKVFRVLLYRLNQIFILQYAQYINQNVEYEVLEETHNKLTKVLKLSRLVFNKRIIKHIEEDFSDLYMLLNHQDTYEKYVLNFQTFVHEDDFYDTIVAAEPIYFFDKKDKIFKIAKLIRKI